MVGGKLSLMLLLLESDDFSRVKLLRGIWGRRLRALVRSFIDSLTSAEGARIATGRQPLHTWSANEFSGQYNAAYLVDAKPVEEMATLD